jgi:hypothetical protein
MFPLFLNAVSFLIFEINTIFIINLSLAHEQLEVLTALVFVFNRAHHKRCIVEEINKLWKLSDRDVLIINLDYRNEQLIDFLFGLWGNPAECSK